MANRIQLPRAPGPGPMLVDGEIWDQLCDFVEWLGGIQIGGAVRTDAQTGPIFIPRNRSPDPPPEELVCKPTAARSGEPGWYDGQYRDPDTGEYPGATNCKIYNPNEALSSGHGLRLGQDIVAKDTGSVTDDDPPRKVLDALTGEARTDSPTVLPWGVGLTLDTTEWCRDTSNGPVEWDGPRGVYDLGSYKYYIVTRKHIYDARGGLYKIGPEVATDYVTATVGCPTPP